VPLEVLELARHVSWAGGVVLFTNLLVLAILWRGRAR